MRDIPEDVYLDCAACTSQSKTEKTKEGCMCCMARQRDVARTFIKRLQMDEARCVQKTEENMPQEYGPHKCIECMNLGGRDAWEGIKKNCDTTSYTHVTVCLAAPEVFDAWTPIEGKQMKAPHVSSINIYGNCELFEPLSIRDKVKEKT